MGSLAWPLTDYEAVFAATSHLIASSAKLGTLKGEKTQDLLDDIVMRCEITLRGVGYCGCSPLDSPRYDLHTERYSTLMGSVLATSRALSRGSDAAAAEGLTLACADPSLLAVFLSSTTLRAVGDHMATEREWVGAALAMAIEEGNKGEGEGE